MGALPHQQRALDQAVAVRKQRAKLRADVRAGDVDPFAVVEGGDQDWEAVAKRMRLDRLLLMIRGIGEGTLRELFAQYDLPSDVRVHALTFGLRRSIADDCREALGQVAPPRAPEGTP